jgi:CheY-like chemotaxis protein
VADLRLAERGPGDISLNASPKAVDAMEILLVEDNLDDARVTMEALKEGVRCRVTLVCDGEEAMAFLRKEGKYSKVPRPDLILLDLNLPKKDGREVLAEIKNDDELKRIPVVVLTISSAEEDILKSYNLHANCFITKPIDLNQFMKVVQSVEDFWLTIVKLPNGGS